MAPRSALKPALLKTLRSLYGDRLQENVRLSGYTSARIGGPADALLFVRSGRELQQAAEKLWELQVPFHLIAGGSNVLVSDRGLRGVALINRARAVRFELQDEPPAVSAESGTTLNDMAQRAARLGLEGLEWAAAIPGSLGGAVYGNAGAFGGVMADNLVSLELVTPEGTVRWTAEQMEYGYRTSRLKREPTPAIILSAVLRLRRGDPAAIRERMAANSETRRRTQPAGASMGSMFKNPPGDKAGRLIEAAGLKGTRIGTAEISSQHANFFLNTDRTSAADMRSLLELAQKTVLDKFGVALEPEIEMIGEW